MTIDTESTVQHLLEVMDANDQKALRDAQKLDPGFVDAINNGYGVDVVTVDEPRRGLSFRQRIFAPLVVAKKVTIKAFGVASLGLKKLLSNWIIAICLLLIGGNLGFAWTNSFHTDATQVIVNSPRGSVMRGIYHYNLHTKQNPRHIFYTDEIDHLVRAEEVSRFLQQEHGISETWEFSEFGRLSGAAVQVKIPQGFNIDAMKLEVEEKFGVQVYISPPSENHSVDTYIIGLDYHFDHLPSDYELAKGSPELRRS